MSATMQPSISKPVMSCGITQDGLLGKRALGNLAGLEQTDAMPPDLRQCVHEFGLPIVDAFLQAGISKPSIIRNLVKEVWAGPRSGFQKHSAGQGTTALGALDWLLLQSGAQITAAMLLRVLWDRQLVIVPVSIHDTHPATQASMATVLDHTQPMTKARKHALRLSAGIRAAALSMWPSLRRDAL